MDYSSINGERKLQRKGFRLRTSWLSVRWSGLRFLFFRRCFCKWKFSGRSRQAIELLKKCSAKRTRSNGNLEAVPSTYVSSSTSFYSDAIDDCLEFIKMCAISAPCNWSMIRNLVAPSFFFFLFCLIIIFFSTCTFPLLEQRSRQQLQPWIWLC